MDGKVTRRDTLTTLAVGVGTSLAGCAIQTAEDADRIDLEQLENVLEIPSDTTHSVSESETYDSVLWQDRGTLELGKGSSVELTEIQ